MTIVSVKPEKTEDVHRIEFSDGSLFSFKNCYLPPVCANGAFEGQEINSAEEEGFRFASSCLRAEKAALQLIARAEQNTFGLSRKLERKKHDSACVRAVIAQLCEIGLLDDCRYARLWLESRISQRASSPRKLFAALCARVDRHDAETVLKAALDYDAERQLLERYMQKLRRGRTYSEPDTEAGRRSLRFLLKSEGFSSSVIQDFFDAVF